MFAGFLIKRKIIKKLNVFFLRSTIFDCDNTKIAEILKKSMFYRRVSILNVRFFVGLVITLAK
jgi:hypothetical protein